MYRRAHERFFLDSSASLITQKDTTKHLSLKDLSARGAGVVGDWPLSINERVAIIINASFFFDKPVSKQAKVVWCKKMDCELWQAGLDFGLDNLIDLA